MNREAMFLNKKKTIEFFVLQHLKQGSRMTGELLKLVKKDKPETSKQGLYGALKSLRRREVIVIHNGQVSLNLNWIRQLSQFVETVEYSYFDRAYCNGSFLNLHEGEKNQYTFTDTIALDAFWNHALIMLLRIHTDSEPLYLYDPHSWFILARPQAEGGLIQVAKETGHQFLQKSAGKTQIDKLVYKIEEFEFPNAQYHMIGEPLFKRKNYYVTTIGEFLIEVWLAKAINNKIDELYKQDDFPNALTVQKKLQEIIEIKASSKLVISRNRNKAKRLQKKLRRGFHVLIKK